MENSQNSPESTLENKALIAIICNKYDGFLLSSK